MRKILATLVIMIMAVCSAHAQEYRYEVGAGVGMTGYLGDVNKSNPWKHPGLGGGVLFRYLPDTRWAVKANVYGGGISGSSADYKMNFPEGAIYSFKSTLIDFGAQVEFNFFDYGIGPTYMKLKRWSPYITLGLGGTVATGLDKTGFAVNVPMGVGIKFKVKERLNLGLECTMRKAFGDGLDGLSDLNKISSSFAKNTDWYSFTMFSITYEFSKRCSKCHYVD